MSDYLPIGSVVLLNGMNKRVLIYGRMQQNSNGHIYDYVGCLFPEGIQDSKIVQLFNHDDIQVVFSLGYQDRAEFLLREQLKQRKGGAAG